MQSSSAEAGYSNYWYTNYGAPADNTDYETKQSQYGYYDHRYTQEQCYTYVYDIYEKVQFVQEVVTNFI